jgi:hypothetical protein
VRQIAGNLHARAELTALWQGSSDLGAARSYLIISPVGLTRYQTPPTPWPVTSPGALSLA